MKTLSYGFLDYVDDRDILFTAPAPPGGAGEPDPFSYYDDLGEWEDYDY